MKPIKILVAEDEESIREFIVINLKRAGYDVVEAVDGLDAYEKYKLDPEGISIAVLDIMMLTAKTQEMDKVNGLLLGADDYVTKPFSPSEFTARVDALARRVSSSSKNNTDEADENIITSGDFKLDCKSRTLTCAGKKIDVTQVEFQILEYFFRNQGTNLSRTDILNHVWGTEYFGEEKIVDVNVRRIRKKIEPDPSNPKHLLTRWGFGYVWI